MYESYHVTTNQFMKLESQMAKQQLQMASGKEFIRPSDDPIKLNQKTLIVNSKIQIEQYQSNINDARSFLETVEITLGSTVDALQRAREIGLMASNDTYNADDLATFQKEIEDIISLVLTNANKKHLDRYLFSGEKTDTPAFTYTGAAVTYDGDFNAQTIKVSPYLDVKISETGDMLFQNALTELINLRDQIGTGNTANITNAINQLDTAINEVIDNRSMIGDRLNTIEILSDTFEETKIDLEDKRSGVEDIDMSKLSIEFIQTRLLYQASLKTATTIMQTGLLSFI